MITLNRRTPVLYRTDSKPADTSALLPRSLRVAAKRQPVILNNHENNLAETMQCPRGSCNTFREEHMIWLSTYCVASAEDDTDGNNRRCWMLFKEHPRRTGAFLPRVYQVANYLYQCGQKLAGRTPYTKIQREFWNRWQPSFVNAQACKAGVKTSNRGDENRHCMKYAHRHIIRRKTDFAYWIIKITYQRH